jgi:hypothetical protein
MFDERVESARFAREHRFRQLALGVPVHTPIVACALSQSRGADDRFDSRSVDQSVMDQASLDGPEYAGFVLRIERRDKNFDAE